MKEFLAHFHPVLVHLPIGILLLAAIFAWMGRWERHAPLLAALPILLRLGAVAAVAACGSGWLLGDNGEYDPDMLWFHKWLGILTAFLAVLACFVPKPRLMTTLTAISLTIAAHFGGTLTHGAGYLSPSIFKDSQQRPSIADIQEAAVFSAVVQTILKEKCSNCHGSTKKKGGLRLDMVEYIQKGGKNGDVLKSVGPDGSELLRRCLLPIGHEDHMPPKEKPQLSSDELEILRWWLAEGADFERKTKDILQSEMVRKALANWQKGGTIGASPAIPDIPEAAVQAASPQLLKQLRQAGVLVLPISRETNWLSVSFVNLPKPTDSVLVLLEKIAPQVLWLNMSDCSLSETSWKSIGELQQLRRLSLNHSSVTDSSLLHLKNMHQLQVLNISDTKVTGEGLGALANLKALHTIFLYKTGIQAQEWPALTALFPQTKLDSGGYQIPFLETDTLRKEMEKTY